MYMDVDLTMGPWVQTELDRGRLLICSQHILIWLKTLSVTDLMFPADLKGVSFCKKGLKFHGNSNNLQASNLRA